jgi:CubicO group peptidase (beta-lactamase class C family)
MPCPAYSLNKTNSLETVGNMGKRVCKNLHSEIALAPECPTSLHIAGKPERWGHGAMWRVWDAPVFPGRIYDGPLQVAYTAMGTGGQYITVLPKEDIVIAHKVNIDKDAMANISPEGYDAVLAMVIDSKCAGSCP